MKYIYIFSIFLMFNLSASADSSSCLLRKLSNLKNGSRYTTITDQFLSEFVVRLSEIETLLKDPKNFKNSIEVLELKSESKYIYEKMIELLNDKGISKSYHQKNKIQSIKNQYLKLNEKFDIFFSNNGIPLDYNSLVKMYPVETLKSNDELLKAKQLYSVLLDKIYDMQTNVNSLVYRRIQKELKQSLEIIDTKVAVKTTNKNSSSILNSPNYNEIIVTGFKNSDLKEAKIGKGIMDAKFILHRSEDHMVVFKSSTDKEFRIAAGNKKEVEMIFGEGKKYLSKRYSIIPGTTRVREVAGYQLSNELGFDLVPVTREITLKDGTIGSVQDFKDGYMMAFESYGKRKDFLSKSIFDDSSSYVRPNKNQLHELAVFDLISGSIDRNSANWMLDKNGNIAAIDNGLSFPMEIGTSFINFSWESAIVKSPDMEILSLEMVQVIKKINVKKISKVMRSNNIEEPAIKLMEERIELMQRYVEGKDQVKLLELSSMIKHHIKGNKYELESFFNN